MSERKLRIAPSEETLPSDVETIAAMEEDSLSQRTPAERISEWVLQRIGSLRFVAAHVAWIGVWIAANIWLVAGIEPFDPFPFGVLALMLGIEAVFIGIFVLISQNRMARDANRRAHLALQVAILAERETTEILRIVSDLERAKGAASRSKAHIKRLARRTHLKSLAREIDKKVPKH
jgi:uncharacterized membrane protein